ncbi:hypothetical protein ACWDTP_37210 [Mycobacterium sp. NPDC003449]
MRDNSLEILKKAVGILPTLMPEYLDIACLWPPALVQAYATPPTLDQIVGETANRIDALIKGDPAAKRVRTALPAETSIFRV